MENNSNKSTTELQDEFDPTTEASEEQFAETAEIEEDGAKDSHEEETASEEKPDKSDKKVCKPEGITIGDRNHGFLYKIFYESGPL